MYLWRLFKGDFSQCHHSDQSKPHLLPSGVCPNRHLSSSPPASTAQRNVSNVGGHCPVRPLACLPFIIQEPHLQSSGPCPTRHLRFPSSASASTSEAPQRRSWPSSASRLPFFHRPSNPVLDLAGFSQLGLSVQACTAKEDLWGVGAAIRAVADAASAGAAAGAQVGGEGKLRKGGEWGPKRQGFVICLIISVVGVMASILFGSWQVSLAIKHRS